MAPTSHRVLTIPEELWESIAGRRSRLLLYQACRFRVVPLGSLELSSQDSANARDLGLVKVEEWAAAGISEGLPDRCAALPHTALYCPKIGSDETIFMV